MNVNVPKEDVLLCSPFHCQTLTVFVKVRALTLRANLRRLTILSSRLNGSGMASHSRPDLVSVRSATLDLLFWKFRLCIRKTLVNTRAVLPTSMEKLLHRLR
uniref:(northern house mosquito) hypothetical protein n=1 Tax=Culex pipiens TaxID=7175 RepID=A0A8D8C8H4_CULPI